jgi:hypothetical protein
MAEAQTVTKDDGLNKLVKMFEESEQTTRSARQLSERDNDYFHNRQWTSDEESTLKARKQPIVTYNRIQRKVNFLSGLEKQQRKDPKAFPVTPDDEDASEAATDALRYVCTSEKWDKKRSAAWKNLLIEGTAAILVHAKQGKQGYDPAITHIPWDRFFYDPASSDQFFADARYMGIVTWYDYDAAALRWEGKEDILEGTLANGKNDETYDDKPKHGMWADAKRRRVRVIEMYHLEGGQWMRCVFTQAGYLEDKAPSPYLDKDKQPENPIKAASLYVDRDNNRYGEVRVLISPQDVVNKTHSKWMHFNNMRQVRVGMSASQDAETIRKELAKPDGIVQAEKEDFEILPTQDLAQAQFNMLQISMNEIDLLGANAALQGKNENDMSGRAILAQQQGGMVEVADPFDVLRELTLSVYDSAWCRVRQTWTVEKWLRVTDNDKNIRFVGLNQQVTVQMLAQEAMQGDQKAVAKFGQLVGTQLMQAAMAGDQQAQVLIGSFVQQSGQQVVETRNAVNELDVDIVIDEGMDTPTVQAEQFDTFAKVIPGIVNLPPPYAKMLVMASSLRDKEKMLELIDEMTTAPPVDPAQEQMKQLAVAGAAAEVENTQADTQLKQSQAANQGATQQDPMEQQFRAAELQTDRFAAVTDRIQALQPAQPARAA